MNLGIVTAVGNWVSSYFERKATEQQAKAQRAIDMQVSSDNYDTAALKAMQFTLKDEYLLITLTAPIWYGLFDPGGATEWVVFISALPLWYQVLLGGIVASTFGLRWWFKKEQTAVYKEVLSKGSTFNKEK
ncbi:hypothetical protein vBAmePR8F_gp49 [Alteromonas phage vB_AmeP_R8W]|uniref:Holin n=1 Tax=Alteromonas phage vB_AmeP_R8W TaxID=2774152 RepID=A0A8E4RFZ8_9CAUD|nr:hypothetical protein vBAmePR8F_gp49 [Alteromonas phage vB_AmeP_R8W]